MNIYIETNFLLELAFVQEEHESCDRIAGMCESGRATLLLPAFSIAESFERLVRRANRRAQIADEIARERREFARSKPYQGEADAFDRVKDLLGQSSQDEELRLDAVLRRVLAFATIIPLEAGIVWSAGQHRTTYELELQDSVVYASVLHHLASAGGTESCFLDRNKKDFDDPNIAESLEKKNCKMLFSFVNGVNYIQHRLNAEKSVDGE